jgi:hypothetical protein
MEWHELDNWAQALLVKINAITGWTIPDETTEILVDQFRKKLSESYANCNPDEVEYAFRNYGTAVKDWGKQMNLSLIDEVMIPYLGRRLELSRLEEQKSKPIHQIENKEDMSMEAMQMWFDEVKGKIKSGTIKLEFIPPMLYEWMNENGNINKTSAEKHEYIRRATNYRLGKLREELENDDNATNRYALSEFVRMMDAGCLEGSEVSKVKILAKQICFFEVVAENN